MINHHLDSATLMSYAAGSLNEALAAVAASHIAGCPTCRNELRACNAIGGALLESVDTEHTNDLELTGMIEEITRYETAQSAPAPVTGSTPPLDGQLPTPLRSALGTSLDEISWKRMAPGIRYFPIPLSDGESGDLRLLNIQPGRRMPEHGHGGTELTLVLTGSYHDEIGHFGPGDVADLDEDVDHQPVVGDQGCICLVASEQPARFHGFISRMIQPLVGM